MSSTEYNFDGLVGPTHNYAGLSYGNVASTGHRDLASNPRQAALQGLEKMKTVSDLGIGQAILPPLARPRVSFLRAIGFSGSRQKIIEQAARQNPTLLASVYSASNMWTANAATISPAADCDDQRLHLTVANLSSGLHRSIEVDGTHRVLSAIFADENHFCVHPPLPDSQAMTDEGAANHTRLCGDFSQPGVEIFVYGRSSLDQAAAAPQKFPARQTLEASRAVARRHRLDPAATLFVQQNPAAIDAGVFHNDVISVGNQHVLLCHESAFLEQQSTLARISEAFASTCGRELVVCELPESEIPLEKCVSSYLFNSQLLTRPDGRMLMICPTECEQIDAARKSIDRIVQDVDSLDDVMFLDLRQSMNNGGGPACLRLRVCLNQQQIDAIHPHVLLTEDLYQALKHWIEKHYRDQLVPADLADPALPIEVDAAFVELADILQLPLLEFSKMDTT